MLRVGTSGWQYRDWRGTFYPSDLAQRRWLPYYAERFETVEVNNTFYRLPAADTFAAWAATVPTSFCFACKMSRYLTHIKRLSTTEPVDRFCDRAAPLGDRLGPILLQLPPTLRAAAEPLDAVLDAFPAGARVAVEPRNPTWFSEAADAVAAVLRGHDAALVWSDRLSRAQGPLWPTASWCYVRFHQGRGGSGWSYGDRALSTWIERIGALGATAPDGYVYFNNDPGGAAPANAERFRVLAARAGLAVT